MVWDGLVAVDLFCAGVGAWTLIFTVLASMKNTQATKMKLIGFIIAFVAVAVGALILAVDARGGLLHPIRYFYLLSNLGSVMTWGVILISIFLLAAFVAIVLLLVKKPVPKAVEWVAVISGVGVSLYTGILLSMSCGAYPLWSPLVLPLLFLVSAAYAGYATHSLVARFTAGDSFETPAWFGMAALVLPVVELVLVAALILVTASVSDSSAFVAAATVAGLLSGSYALLFWVGMVLIGLVLPLALELYRRAQGAKAPAWIACVEWIAIIVGCFILRYVVIMAAIPTFA